MPHQKTPTEETYSEMQYAYDFFNQKLFDDELPQCLITLQRKNQAMGYFSPERFTKSTGKGSVDEIAMNPVYFAGVPIIEIMQTLVHEMCHLWQHHFGKSGRGGYHNKQWGSKMKQVGLYPSSTGREGGKETGDSMSDYVITGGLFEQVCNELLQGDTFQISWVDKYGVLMATLQNLVGSDSEPNTNTQTNTKPNKSNRSKYSCDNCTINLWGKPTLHIICGECEEEFVEV